MTQPNVHDIRPAGKNPALTLDDLAQMSVDELTTVYQNGTAPSSLTALDGPPHGRMLRTIGPLGKGVVGAAVSRWASSSGFPWGGKTFTATTDAAGTGINRVKLMGDRDWFPFDTSIQPSVTDGEPCVVLDYDKPENPWAIRQVHDELREVSPGLFLGPAMAKTSSGPRLVLYFAIDRS